MDNGDSGDNLRQIYANALIEGGFSKTDALWITDAGMRAASAAYTALETAMDSEFRGMPPVNVAFVAVGVLEVRLAVMRALLDAAAHEQGGEVVETRHTVSDVAIMSLDRRTVQ